MARKSMTKLNAPKTTRSDTAAARPQVAIEIRSTTYSSAFVRMTFRWPAGRKESSAALHAQIHQAIADCYAAAAASGSGALVGQPQIDGLTLAGGDALQATVDFETMNGTRAEAEAIDALLHDAVPAPL